MLRDEAQLFFSFIFHAFFDAHVFEFAGFKDLAAFQTFQELGIFIAANHLDAWMLAWRFCVLWLGGRLRAHKSGEPPSRHGRGTDSQGISRYSSPGLQLVKCSGGAVR